MSDIFRVIFQAFGVLIMELDSDDEKRFAAQYYKYFKFAAIVKAMPGSFRSQSRTPFDYYLEINIFRTMQQEHLPEK